MLSVVRTILAGILALTVVTLGGMPASSAEPSALAPFRFDPKRPDIVELDGALTSGAALAFRRTLLAAPNARLLVLNSPGGDVDAGLLIADDVHTRKLDTLIPDGSTCASACSYIFLAGHERQADGRLGVHQMWSERPNLQSAQMSVADVIDTLDRFGTPTGVITIMFRTPPDDMHFFTPDEVARFGINKTAGAAVADVTVAPMAPSPSPDANQGITPAPADAVSMPNDGTQTEAAALAAPSPAMSDRTAAALSTLETYTKQPTRMAIYAGLDFFGEDVGSTFVADAPACAAKCFELGGQCRAFTFNMKTRPGRGPNCFLKSGRGEVDGNSAAFSGELLSRSDRDPSPMTIPVIDPETALFQNVDLPGYDLSRRPNPAATQFECRRACVADDRCVAFTYVKPKKQCWLKGGAGSPRAMAGAVTGIKKVESFSAQTITLD
ncbi:hypothetical protein SAMN05216566_11283 [Aureimonas phyllosphaerae]|nr:hypothetical protein SAMN05216566_11283 [Aureimonas phyllosphaerae]